MEFFKGKGEDFARNNPRAAAIGEYLLTSGLRISFYAQAIAKGMAAGAALGAPIAGVGALPGALAGGLIGAMCAHHVEQVSGPLVHAAIEGTARAVGGKAGDSIRDIAPTVLTAAAVAGVPGIPKALGRAVNSVKQAGASTGLGLIPNTGLAMAGGGRGSGGPSSARPAPTSSSTN